MVRNMKPKIRATDNSRNPKLGVDPFGSDENHETQFLLVTKMRAAGTSSIWIESEAHALDYLEGLGSTMDRSRLLAADQQPLKAWAYDLNLGELYEIPVAKF